MVASLELVPGEMTFSDLHLVSKADIRLTLSKKTRLAVQRCKTYLNQKMRDERVIYGINTGFGALAEVMISEEHAEQLQANLLLSHAVGVGSNLDDAIVRIIMALKINSLCRGFSGVSITLVERLLTLYNSGVIPLIPEKGSVGASGDLAPLAHCYICLIGRGQVKYGGVVMPAKTMLKQLDLEPLSLQPKEGLALINGTQVSTALACNAMHRSIRLLHSAIVVGALAVDALHGSDTPFKACIHEVRGHGSQQAVASEILRLLHGSEIIQSHQNAQRVQDPYSLRCQPQVMGSAMTAIEHAKGVILTEANAVTDNPLVFECDGQVLSGGNFHAEPIAMVADYLALALAEIGSISERRISLMIDKNMSKLPAFLVDDGGLHSGFMIAHVTATALVSENKSLAHPAVVDSLPTSANQEDHVSMATFAARRLADMLDNVEYILAIELLAIIQALKYYEPLQTGIALRPLYRSLSQSFEIYRDDRVLANDIEMAKDWLAIGRCSAYSRLSLSD